MTLTTKRLTVRPATDGEMRAMIEAETDEGLRAAYGEMLECSAAHPAQRQWYAAWLIALPTGENGEEGPRFVWGGFAAK